MPGLQTCLFKYIIVAAFHIYAQGGEDAAKKLSRNKMAGTVVFLFTGGYHFMFEILNAMYVVQYIYVFGDELNKL